MPKFNKSGAVHLHGAVFIPKLPAGGLIRLTFAAGRAGYKRCRKERFL